MINSCPSVNGESLCIFEKIDKKRFIARHKSTAASLQHSHSMHVCCVPKQTNIRCDRICRCRIHTAFELCAIVWIQLIRIQPGHIRGLTLANAGHLHRTCVPPLNYWFVFTEFFCTCNNRSKIIKWDGEFAVCVPCDEGQEPTADQENCVPCPFNGRENRSECFNLKLSSCSENEILGMCTHFFSERYNKFSH